MIELKAPVFTINPKTGKIILKKECNSVQYKCVSSVIYFEYPSYGPYDVDQKIIVNNKLVMHAHYANIGGSMIYGPYDGDVEVILCGKVRLPAFRQPITARIYRILEAQVDHLKPLTITIKTDSNMHVTIFVDNKRYVYTINGTRKIVFSNVRDVEHKVCVFAGIVIYKNGKYIATAI